MEKPLVTKRGSIISLIFIVVALVISYHRFEANQCYCTSNESTRQVIDVELCQSDRRRVRAHKALLKETGKEVDVVVENLQKVVMDVVRTGCRSFARVGGQLNVYKFPDGHKYVCYDDVDFTNNCLVYSFGLASDWSFEEEMVKRGCTVHAFDYSINMSTTDPDALYEQVGPQFHVYRVAAANSTNTDLGQLRKLRSASNPAANETLSIRLADALKNNGDWDRTITYLKIDIEGDEVYCLPEWLRSGALHNVKQIGMELHAKPDKAKATSEMLLELFEDGFVNIMWDPNLVVGRRKFGFYYSEIVLRRTDVCVA